jgi:putative ABC transport system permease protein
MIIALGSACYVGIGAAAPGMMVTGQTYFAQTNFYDIKLISTNGFNRKDMEEISNIKGIQDIAAIYSADILVDMGSNKHAFKVLSIDDQWSASSDASVNIPQVVKGKYPQQDNECLIDARFADAEAFAIGKKITLISEDGAQHPLAYHEYLVSGYAQTPVYISEDRGNTKIGDGKLWGFVLIPAASWELDQFTEVYLTIQKDKTTNSSTDSYQNKVEPVGRLMDALNKTRASMRYAGVPDEFSLGMDYLAKMYLAIQSERSASGLNIFDSSYGQKIEPVSELIRELGEVRTETWYAETVDEIKTNIEAAKKKISDGRAALARAQEEIERAERDIADREQALNQNTGSLEEEKSKVSKELTDTEAALRKTKEQIDAKEREIANGRKELDASKTNLQQSREHYAQEQSALAQLGENVNALDKELKEKFNYMEYRQIELLDLRKSLNKKIEQNTPDAEEEIVSLSARISEIEQEVADYSGTTAHYDTLLQEYRTRSDTLPSLRREIETSEANIQAREKALAEAQNTLEQTKKAYQSDLSKYNEQTSILSQTQQNTVSTLQGAVQTLEEIRKKLEDERNALQRDGLQTEKEILEAEDSIAENEMRLKELEIPTREFNIPKWYVLNASLNPGFSKYKAHVQGMRALASVLPFLFFLAAVLVSFIAMAKVAAYDRARMRGWHVSADSSYGVLQKYILYSVSASVLGCAIGSVVGFNLLPKLIFHSYEATYPAFPPVALQFNVYSAAIAVALAIAGTILASVVVWFRYQKDI